MDANALRSGKTHRDENFPVARLVRARHREAILAFYEFVRTADDIADHPELAPDAKLRALDGLEQTLAGRADAEPAGTRLREALTRRGLSDRHARDLLRAFRQDVVKLRYDSWEELIAYCALSAMPVGRFVLDVHGESPETWSASDPLCAALQIINHTQDCGEDYRRLNRVYIPLDAMERAGASVEDLGASRASPALRDCLAKLAHKTRPLVQHGGDLVSMTADFRLSMECAVIHKVAEKLVGVLTERDPLSEPVRLGAFGYARAALAGLAGGAFSRLGRFSKTASLGGKQA